MKNDPKAHDITDLLNRAHSDPEAENRLMELVYDELRGEAARHIRDPRDGPSSLVSDLWERLFRKGFVKFENRRTFFALAIKVFDNLIIDRHRARTADKRGGEIPHEPIDIAIDQYIGNYNAQNELTYLELNDILSSLKLDDLDAEIWQFYFARFTRKEIAELVGVTESKVRSTIARIKADLKRRLQDDA